jgi:hypothetical protein
MAHHIDKSKYNEDIKERNDIIVYSPVFFKFSSYHDADIRKEKRYQYNDVI